MVTQNYTISTVKTATPPKVKMSQYDYGMRTITFAVVDGSGAAVDLTGKTVTVEGTRIDGHAFAAACTVSGSTVSFVETVDMTNQAGDHPAELVVRESGQRLGTMNFIISVEPAAMDEDAEITEEDQSLFDQLYTSIDDAEAEIGTAKDAALQEIAQGLASGSPLIANTAAAMTDTDEVYLYTGAEPGYTAGSWYYYNGTAWVVGGVYGAGTTDTTLTLAGMAADAKATGDEISNLKSALFYKTDNKYGGAESSTDVTLTNKKTWNGSNGNQSSSNARACSEQITRTPDMKGIVCANGYSMTVMGNNSGSGSAMTTIDTTWVSSVDLTDVTYKYLFISIKKSDGSNFDTGTTTGVIGIKKYTEIVPYLTDEDLSDIEADIDSVESDIDSLQDAVFVTTNISLVNNSGEVGSGAMPNTRRWILPSIIPSGSTISNIKYRTASSVSGTIIFEVWKKNGDTLTLDKSVTNTPAASSENTVAIGYTSTTDIMFGWRLADGTSIRQKGSTTFNMWATTDMSSSTLDTNDLDKNAFTTYTPCITVPYTNVSAKKYAQFPQNVVTVGEGMDFEQIQDAIDGIVDDSASKPYTILVMPKGTPYERFSTLRKYTQTYPWNSIAPRYISIIGLDKKHCVIRSDSGNYKLPCGEPMLNGAIKNLTFIMTNDDQDETATQGGYCLHIDCRTLNDIGYNMLIEDCDFEDASGPCLGIGMHKNCTLTIRRCSFKTTLSANYSPHEGYTNLCDYGVIFCHSSTRSDATNQRINIEDCFGVCAEGNKSLWLSIAGDYSPVTASFYYRMLRNVFWNETQNAPAYSISGTLTAEPMNFGNNIPT